MVVKSTMMGTCQIAMVAKSMNKPVYVAAESLVGAFAGIFLHSCYIDQ